jgi:hypothetical protein
MLQFERAVVSGQISRFQETLYVRTPQIVGDIVVLRDAACKGQLNWRIWPIAFGFVLFLYGTGIPTVLLYEKHPQYEPLFIAAVIFDGILFICFMGWAWRWQSRQSAARKPLHST